MAFENLTQGLMRPQFGLENIAPQLPGLFGESAIKFREKEGLRILSETAMNPDASKEAVFGVMQGVTKNMGVNPEKALEVALRGESVRNQRAEQERAAETHGWNREDRVEKKAGEAETLELLKKYEPSVRDLKTLKAAQAKLQLDDRSLDRKVKQLQYQESLNEAQQNELNRQTENIISGVHLEKIPEEVLNENPELRNLLLARAAAKKAGNDKAVAALTTKIAEFRQEIYNQLVESLAALEEAKAKAGNKGTMEEALTKIKLTADDNQWKAMEAQFKANGVKLTELEARRAFPYYQLMAQFRGSVWSTIKPELQKWAILQMVGKSTAEIDSILLQAKNWSEAKE